MSSRARATRRFWRSVLQLFLVYLVIIPVIFFLLDQDTFLKWFREEPVLFPLELAGVAMGISLLISFWSRRDPELRKW